MSKEATSQTENFNIDEALARLEAINQQLAQENLPLEKSLELYEKGVALAARCKKELEGVEKKLIVLNES